MVSWGCFNTVKEVTGSRNYSSLLFDTIYHQAFAKLKMKSVIRRLALIAATATSAAMSTLSPVPPAAAAQFGQQEVDQNKFIAIAAPVGATSHQLLILEQISNSRACWSESGSAPTVVDPLLLKFDFTGICGRSTDSNGYSVRVADQDLGVQYSLRLVKQANDLKLMAVSNRDRSTPPIEIGRTQAIANGFTKIELNQGWRLTKRTYNGRALGHVYLTNNQDLPTLIAAAGGSRPQPAPVTRPVTPSQPVQPPTSIPVGTSTGSGSTSGRPLPAPPTVVTTQPGSSSSSGTGGYTVPTVQPGGPSTARPPVTTPTPATRPTTPPPVYRGTPPSPTDRASSLGFNYRVIVPASSTAQQQRIKTLVPGAFRTVINGQVYMQTGLFRTQPEAESFKQSLSRQNLQASVVSVAATTPTNTAQAPSSPSPTPNLPSVPNGRIVAVIDAGHGGGDPGAVGICGLMEKEINLSISQEVARLLEQQGVQVVMTRRDDREIDLAPRVSAAERARADVFVSIHSNSLSLSRPDVNGIETYYYSSGKKLAESIHSSLIQSTNARDRGVRTANFYVIKNTSMPAVLVEVGFVTGKEDSVRLSNANSRKQMAAAIARGILQYVKQNP